MSIYSAGVQEHWMRMRDRRTILAIPVLALAYLALLTWGLAGAVHGVTGTTLPVPDSAMRWLLAVNFALLAWRLAIRAVLVARNYGRWQALRSIPRLLVANGIALLAARRATLRYLRSLRGGTLVWDKTAHHFPTAAELTAR